MFEKIFKEERHEMKEEHAKEMELILCWEPEGRMNELTIIEQTIKLVKRLIKERDNGKK